MYLTFRERYGLEVLCIEAEIVDLMTTCCKALDDVTVYCRSEAIGRWMGVDDVNTHFCHPRQPYSARMLARLRLPKVSGATAALGRDWKSLLIGEVAK